MQIPEKWPHEVVIEELGLDASTKFPTNVINKLKGFKMGLGKLKNITDDAKMASEVKKLADMSSQVAGMLLAAFGKQDDESTDVAAEAAQEAAQEINNEAAAAAADGDSGEAAGDGGNPPSDGETEPKPNETDPEPPASQEEERPREVTKAELEAHILNSGLVKEGTQGVQFINHEDLEGIGVKWNPRQSYALETKKFRYDGLTHSWSIKPLSKGIGAIGWLGLAVTAVVAGFVGKKVYDNYQSKK